MMIVEDTRNKSGKHENKHGFWDEHGTPWIRSALPWGDYWAAPRIAVDTKQDIQEITANMCGAAREKKRFREECKKASAAGCKLVFLVEDERFTKPEDLIGQHIYILNGMTIPGDQVFTAMRMHEERYGCEFRFCDPKDSGRIIEEILSDGR